MQGRSQDFSKGGSQRLLTRSPSGDRRRYMVYTAALPRVSAGSIDALDVVYYNRRQNYRYSLACLLHKGKINLFYHTHRKQSCAAAWATCRKLNELWFGTQLREGRYPRCFSPCHVPRLTTVSRQFSFTNQIVISPDVSHVTFWP